MYGFMDVESVMKEIQEGKGWRHSIKQRKS
jgi:hypothetical protein